MAIVSGARRARRRRRTRGAAPGRSTRFPAALLAACGVLGGAGRARADAATATTPEGRGYVELSVVATDEQSAALSGALRELVARLGLGLRVAARGSNDRSGPTSPAGEGERARVWVDETPADHVEIAVAAVRSGGLAAPVGRALPKSASTAILTEQIAHIVHSTLESLLATEGPAARSPDLAPTPPPTPEPAPALTPTPPPAPAPTPPPAAATPAPERPPAPSPAERPGPGLAATVFASGRGIASNTGPVLGGGAGVSFTAWRGFGRPSFWVSGSYNAPFGEGNPDVNLQTTVTSLRAGAAIALLARHAFGLDVGLGAGADVFHVAPGIPSTTASIVTLKSNPDRADPVFTARVSAGMRVAAGARFVVGVDVDCDAWTPRYVTEELASQAKAPVFQPWPVRPAVLLGLCVPLVGDLGCAE